MREEICLDSEIQESRNSDSRGEIIHSGNMTKVKCLLFRKTSVPPKQWKRSLTGVAHSGMLFSSTGLDFYYEKTR